MIKEVKKLRDEFLNKRKSLTEKELVQVKNSLTSIGLAVDKMAAGKEEIYKLINSIRSIIKSYDENENS